MKIQEIYIMLTPTCDYQWPNTHPHEADFQREQGNSFFSPREGKTQINPKTATEHDGMRSKERKTGRERGGEQGGRKQGDPERGREIEGNRERGIQHREGGLTDGDGGGVAHADC